MLELTIVSIKVQEFENIYSIKNGFYKGTIFKDLDKPWRAVKW